MNLGVADRTSDRFRSIWISQSKSRVGCVFGRTIKIEHTLHVRQFIKLINETTLQRFAGKIYGLDGFRNRTRAQQFRYCRRHRVNQGDEVRGFQVSDMQGVVCQDHTTAKAERNEKLEDREVKTDRG